MSKEAKIMVGIAVAVIAGGMLLFVTSGNPQPAEPGQPADSQSLVRETSHMTGKKDAKVTIVEFGDYECPACAAAEPTMERLREEYKNNPEVNFVFRNFPLPQHKKALPAAQVAEAAAEQGKFWEMVSKLYLNQSQWIGANDHQAVFLTYAQELGLDLDKFKTGWQQQKFSAVISSDQADGVTLGVNSTPTIFINGEKMRGFAYETLKTKIEEQLE